MPSELHRIAAYRSQKAASVAPPAGTLESHRLALERRARDCGGLLGQLLGYHQLVDRPPPALLAWMTEEVGETGVDVDDPVLAVDDGDRLR